MKGKKSNSCKEEIVCVAEAIYHFILHSPEKAVTVSQICEGTGVDLRRCKIKLHQLKNQHFLKRNEDDTWSTNLI